MKKTFALILAVAMVMSLAAVSFAAETTTVKDNAKLTLEGPYKYDGDVDSGKMMKKTVEYGKSAYWAIQYEGKLLTNYKDVEKLKVKAKWEMGSDLVDGLAVVKKRVGGDYFYYVEVKTVAQETTSDSDIIGTLTFNKKKSDASKLEFDDAEIDVALNVFYTANWIDSAVNYLIDDSFSSAMKPETKYLLKFDSDEEVDLEFGLDQNEGTFTVDVSGQGKLLLEFNTKANDALVEANPSAKVFFVNFNDAKFNRTGEFAYETETLQHVYQLKDGKLTAIPSAEYDESDETIYFNTRVLGSYVFSDVELVDAPAVDVPDVQPENPTTGAAA
ncbi:MAG: acid shock protein [Candidatus Fimivivens sp.]